jgi:hypothetical protein
MPVMMLTACCFRFEKKYRFAISQIKCKDSGFYKRFKNNQDGSRVGFMLKTHRKSSLAANACFVI